MICSPNNFQSFYLPTIMRACICLICGIPASGKSTTCRNLILSEEFRKSYDIYYICYDKVASLLMEIYPSLSSLESWKKTRDICPSVVKVILQGLSNCSSSSSELNKVYTYIMNMFDRSPSIDKPTIFLLDDNFHYPSMRHKFYSIARSYSVSYCQVLLDSPVEECVARNIVRSKDTRVATPIIHKLAALIQFPIKSSLSNSLPKYWEKGVYSLCFTMKQEEAGLKLVEKVANQNNSNKTLKERNSESFFIKSAIATNSDELVKVSTNNRTSSNNIIFSHDVVDDEEDILDNNEVVLILECGQHYQSLIKSKIDLALNNPVLIDTKLEEKHHLILEEEKLNCDSRRISSILHVADICSRKVIGNFLSSLKARDGYYYSKETLQQTGKKFNLIRKELLNEFSNKANKSILTDKELDVFLEEMYENLHKHSQNLLEEVKSRSSTRSTSNNSTSTL